MLTTNDLFSCEYLVNANKGLVYYIVNRFQVNSFDRDDLIQAGLMGLLQASRKYSIRFNCEFSTYAIPYILGSIKKELNNHNLIYCNYRIRKVANQLKEITNDEVNLSIIELAEKLNTTKETILMAYNYLDNIHFLSDIEVEKIPDQKKNDNILFLSTEENLIYRLWFVKRIKQKEIAKILSLNQSTVSRKIEKIKQKIKS